MTSFAEISDATGGLAASESDSESSTGLYFGFGGEFALTEQLSLRADWDRLRNVDIGDEEVEIDLFSLSLAYHF